GSAAVKASDWSAGGALLRRLRWAGPGAAVTPGRTTAPPGSASAILMAEPNPRMPRAEGFLRSIVVNSPEGWPASPRPENSRALLPPNAGNCNSVLEIDA